MQPQPKRINTKALDAQTKVLEQALQVAEATVERLRARDRARAERASDHHADLSSKYRNL